MGCSVAIDMGEKRQRRKRVVIGQRVLLSYVGRAKLSVWTDGKMGSRKIWWYLRACLCTGGGPAGMGGRRRSGAGGAAAPMQPRRSVDLVGRGRFGRSAQQPFQTPSAPCVVGRWSQVAENFSRPLATRLPPKRPPLPHVTAVHANTTQPNESASESNVVCLGRGQWRA